MDRRLPEAIFLMAGCAIALSLAAHFFVVFPFDLKISQELQEEKNPVFAVVMQGVSALGETWTAVTMIGAVSVVFIIRQQFPEAVFVLATASNFMLTSLVKVLVGRPRPPDFFLNPADMFTMVNQYSFPSGHVLFFIVFFGFIAYLAYLHGSGRVRMMVITVCGTLILLIGPSRIYVGAHWASDVLGSYIIGGLWLFLLILLYQLATHRDTRLKETIQL
jgi:membrane-associated phospholipid phosphatase